MASQWSDSWSQSSSWWQNQQQQQAEGPSGWSLPPPPAMPSPMPSPAPATWPPLPPPTTTWGSTGPNATTSATPNPARVPLPKSFKEDEEHYDSNLVFKATVKKNVEPTAWSRATGIAGMDIRDVTIAHLSRRGLDEFGFRGLSRGRFTGLILTHNVAETVLLSQLQKKLREDNIDVDAAIDALYKSKSMKPPDKLKEAATYVAPLVDEFLHAEHHQEL